MQASGAAHGAGGDDSGDEAAGQAQQPSHLSGDTGQRLINGIAQAEERRFKHEAKVVSKMLLAQRDFPPELMEKLAYSRALSSFKKSYGKKALNRIMWRLMFGHKSAAMEKWKLFALNETQRLRHLGAIAMQRLARGFLARCRVAAIRAELARIAEEERRAHEAFLRVRFVSATRIQRTFSRKMREWKARMHRLHTRTALVIQHAWRAYLKRVLFFKLCLWGRMRRRAAASSIQRSFRAYKVRRHMALLGAMRRAESFVRRKKEAAAAIQERFVCNGCATTLANFWRGRMALWRLRAILRFRRNVFAGKLQRWRRETMARRWQKQRREKIARRNNAATLIAAVWRGYLVRRDMSAVRKRIEAERAEEERKRAEAHAAAMEEMRRKEATAAARAAKLKAAAKAAFTVSCAVCITVKFTPL